MLGKLGLQRPDNGFEKSHVGDEAGRQAIEGMEEESTRRRVSKVRCEIIILERLRRFLR
jgi:hypothetical protein